MKKSKTTSLLVILFLILAFTIAYSFASDSEEMYREQLTIDRSINESLSCSFVEDDVLLIEGRGTVNYYDLEHLEKINDIDMKRIKNIIIGDEVESIGYDCFNKLENLTSIKFGKNVKEIRHFCLRECPMLEYVFLPHGIETLKIDFLYKCDLARIFTDGYEQLPLPDDVNDGRVYTDVSDYDSFETAIGNNQILFAQYPGYDLGVTDLNALGSVLTLHNGITQFGPYATLDKGLYHIMVLGNGFTKLSEENIYVNIGGENSPQVISNLNIDEHRITYDATFEDYVENVEFCIRDDLEEDDLVEVCELDIYTEGSIDCNGLKYWW